jgi:AcrR family transcriptional regulator
MSAARSAGRVQQRNRTRADLLRAALHLSKQGRKPTLEAIAEAALVSRATAYRYFPSVDLLLVEASFDLDTPTIAELFPPGSSTDPIERLERLDTALYEAMETNEAALRTMLSQAVVRPTRTDGNAEAVLRQNRRTPLIEAALFPARAQFKAADLKNLTRALALVIGTEALVVCKDVLRLKRSETLQMKRWTIRALVESARHSDSRSR